MIEQEVEFELNLDVELDMGEGIAVPNAMDEFYNKEFWFSYSSMKLLLYNAPAFAQKYINNIYEEKLDKHLINGKLIHYLILEAGQTNSVNREQVIQSESFSSTFILSPLTIPEGKSLKLVTAVFKNHRLLNNPGTMGLTNYESFILEEMIRMDYWQALKDDIKTPFDKGDNKRLAKVCTDENASYFEYLLTRGNKNVIDNPQLDYCIKAVEVILSDKKLCKLMGIGATDLTKNLVINEKMFYMKLKDYKFGLKGIVDNINIDHTEKIIYVNDFKTTAKELREFAEAVEFFGYYIQCMIYLKLIAYHYKELIYTQGYKVEFRFIAIDKFLQAYAFRITDKSLENWLGRFNEKLTETDYHFTNKSYNLPYAFAREQVVL